MFFEIFLGLEEELLGGLCRFSDTRDHQQLVSATDTSLLLGGIGGTAGLAEQSFNPRCVRSKSVQRASINNFPLRPRICSKSAAGAS